MRKITSPLRIQDLAADEQPREKLMTHGSRSLTDAEVVAILLRTGLRGVSAVELARRVLRFVDHDLHALARLQVRDLTAIGGIGQVKAMQLVAALELGRRREASVYRKRPVLNTSEDCYRYLRPLIGDLNHEEFHLLCLNQGNQLLGAHLISKGGTTATVVDARNIFRTALRYGSVTSVVLAHNHPSGRVLPSRADVLITRKLIRAARSLDLRVNDHLIVAGHAYYSFEEHGLITEEEEKNRE